LTRDPLRRAARTVRSRRSSKACGVSHASSRKGREGGRTHLEICCHAGRAGGDL
jgi:hypothetical protein